MGCLYPSGRAEEIPLISFLEIFEFNVHELPYLEQIPAGASDFVVGHRCQGKLQVLPPLLRHRDEEARAHLAEEPQILASATEFGLDLRLVELHPDPPSYGHLRERNREPTAGNIVRRVHETVGYETPHHVGMLLLAGEVGALGRTGNPSVHDLQILGAGERDRKVYDEHYPIPLALEARRGVAAHVLQNSDHANDGSRVDGAGLGLVVEANVAAHYREIGRA